MLLPHLAIKNHHFTIVILIILTILGVYSFITMPRSEDPQVTVPGASIFVVYPGANPVDMEHLIVDRIEEVVNELEDIDYIDSNIQDGLAFIKVIFEFGIDVDDRYSKIVEKVNSIRIDLPEDILYLEISKLELVDVNILQLALVSESAPYIDMKNQAEELKDRLENILGVRQVKIWACPDEEVQISLDFEKMTLMNISLNQVIGSIKSSNITIPGGSIDAGGKRFNIHTSGSYESLEEIENTIINSASGRIVFLKDIADVSFGYNDMDYHGRFNGQRAIFITLNQKENTNIFSITDKLNKEIEGFKSELPGDMQLFTVFDQSMSVSRRFDLFFCNLFQGILLVGIIIFLGVGFRASVVVMLTVPLSIFIGIGLLDLSGFSLEQISIAGLVLVLGILVDNAIVVTENVSRFLKLGYTHREAAIKGTAQIGWAIMSATATTVFAFIPIMMMQNMTGEFIRSLPVTVVLTLTVSLLLALTFSPYLSSLLLKKPDGKKESRFQSALNRFIERYYRKMLAWSLSNTRLLLIVTLIVFAASLALFPLVGVSLFPKAEKPQFLINIHTPIGTSINKTDEVTAYVEEILAADENILLFASNIGRGNPRIYYNVIPEREKSNHSQVYVELKENDITLLKEVIKDLREKFSNYPGAKIEVKELEQGTPIDAPIAIKIIGNNLDELKRIAGDIESFYESTPNVININNPLSTSKTDIQIKINREKAGILGINLVDIDMTVRSCITGITVSSFRDEEGKDYDIILKGSLKKEVTPEIFEKIYITSLAGIQIPLLQVASVELKSSPLQISHFNLDRCVTITADVSEGGSVEKTTSQIIAKMEGYDWPEGYCYYVAGETESREKAFGGMGIAVIIAMIAIFGVLVLQFRSFTQPFIIFSSIPLAVIGSILTLLVTGNSFSFTAFIGLTSLVGIVVNNAIILVDYTNQLIGEGKSVTDAIKLAGETRFTPIILTTATTVGGLLPLTLQGGTLWAPMGWTIIGGLITSTFLTLIIVPVLYKVLKKFSLMVIKSKV